MPSLDAKHQTGVDFTPSNNILNSAYPWPVLIELDDDDNDDVLELVDLAMVLELILELVDLISVLDEMDDDELRLVSELVDICSDDTELDESDDNDEVSLIVPPLLL